MGPFRPLELWQTVRPLCLIGERSFKILPLQNPSLNSAIPSKARVKGLDRRRRRAFSGELLKNRAVRARNWTLVQPCRVQDSSARTYQELLNSRQVEHPGSQ